MRRWLWRYMTWRSWGLVLRDKAIKPLLAAAQQHRRSRRPQNPSPLDLHYQTIRASMLGVFQELGIAA